MGASRAVPVEDEKRAALRDIEETRDRMGNVVGAIEERLSPAHFREQLQEMKDDALDQFRDAKEQVKTEIRQEVSTVKEEMREATIGRMEHMMHRTTARVRTTGESVVDAVRDNPLPFALIGLGVGWLIASSRKDGRRGTEDERITARGVYDDWEQEPRAGSKARSFVDQGRERVSEAVDRVEDKAHELSTEARERVHEAGQRTREVAHRTRERAMHARDVGAAAVRRGEDRVGAFAHDNPLALGAVVFAVGAAVGLALPHTGVEDRMMGASKERALRKAERVASQAIRRTEAEASSALHEASGAVGPETAPTGTPGPIV
jgi:ElaB/YqjD/DUF883 family membrane-anchored ribosome-binding protein